MANWAVVEDGKVVESTSQTSLKKASDASTNGMDKDAFLQLLVAQMKYQDPLEPTSNTEFVSQYAQFSQVEQMQNMAATAELARATSLVGQEVYVRTTDSAGTERYVTGKVDYVQFEGGKAYLVIDEKLYSLDDLATVTDKDYLAAFTKARDFVNTLAKLPGKYSIGLADGDTIDELEEIYNNMTDYEKSFVAKDMVDLLTEYIERIKQLRLSAGENVDGDGSGGDGSDKTEGTGADGDGSDKVEGAGGDGDGSDKAEGTGGSETGDGTGGTEATE